MKRIDFCFHPGHIPVDLEPDVVEPTNSDQVIIEDSTSSSVPLSEMHDTVPLCKVADHPPTD